MCEELQNQPNLTGPHHGTLFELGVYFCIEIGQLSDFGVGAYLNEL